MVASTLSHIAIVGGGRFARALARSFPSAIALVVTRDTTEAAAVQALLPGSTVASSIEGLDKGGFDTLWIATSDRAITEVAAAIASRRDSWKGVLAIHSSGSMPVSVLQPFAEKGGGIAALHPNASFTGQSAIPLGLAWGIETVGVDRIEIDSLLADVAPRLFSISSPHRPLYHAAASAAANYSVTLFAIAVELYSRSGIPSEEAAAIVRRFMAASVDRAEESGPEGAITGPVMRGDVEVVRGQLLGVARQAGEFLKVFMELTRSTALLFGGEYDRWNELFDSLAGEVQEGRSVTDDEQRGQSSEE